MGFWLFPKFIPVTPAPVADRQALQAAEVDEEPDQDEDIEPGENDGQQSKPWAEPTSRRWRTGGVQASTPEP